MIKASFNPGSALLTYFNTSTKSLLCGDIYCMHFLLYRYGGAKYKQQRSRKTFVAFFFSACAVRRLRQGMGRVVCRVLVLVQRYGPLGLWFVHTCRRTLHNDIGVLGTRGVHIGVRRIV